MCWLSMNRTRDFLFTELYRELQRLKYPTKNFTIAFLRYLKARIKAPDTFAANEISWIDVVMTKTYHFYAHYNWPTKSETDIIPKFITGIKATSFPNSIQGNSQCVVGTYKAKLSWKLYLWAHAEPSETSTRERAPRSHRRFKAPSSHYYLLFSYELSDYNNQGFLCIS